MADARLQRIAADAAARGWDVEWHDSDHRTELLVVPIISGPLSGDLGFGVAVALGGERLVLWAWEAYAGTLIAPWQRSDEHPGIDAEEAFPTVTDLQSCCLVFDQAVRRYLAEMRRHVLTDWQPGTDLTDWADVEPLAQQEVG